MYASMLQWVGLSHCSGATLGFLLRSKVWMDPQLTTPRLPVARAPPPEGIILTITASASVLLQALAHLEFLLVDAIAVRFVGVRVDLHAPVDGRNRWRELVCFLTNRKLVPVVLSLEVLFTREHHFCPIWPICSF